MLQTPSPGVLQTPPPGTGSFDGDTEDDADGADDGPDGPSSGQVVAAADELKTRSKQISWKFPPTTRAFFNIVKKHRPQSRVGWGMVAAELRRYAAEYNKDAANHDAPKMCHGALQCTGEQLQRRWNSLLTKRKPTGNPTISSTRSICYPERREELRGVRGVERRIPLGAAERCDPETAATRCLGNAASACSVPSDRCFDTTEGATQLSYLA